MSGNQKITVEQLENLSTREAGKLITHLEQLTKKIACVRDNFQSIVIVPQGNCTMEDLIYKACQKAPEDKYLQALKSDVDSNKTQNENSNPFSIKLATLSQTIAVLEKLHEGKVIREEEQLLLGDLAENFNKATKVIESLKKHISFSTTHIVPATVIALREANPHIDEIQNILDNLQKTDVKSEITSENVDATPTNKKSLAGAFTAGAVGGFIGGATMGLGVGATAGYIATRPRVDTHALAPAKTIEEASGPSILEKPIEPFNAAKILEQGKKSPAARGNANSENVEYIPR